MIKVKQLVWGESESYLSVSWMTAKSPLGKYETLKTSDGTFSAFSQDPSLRLAAGLASLDAAKVAAQADFERRVRECLEVEE